MKKNLRLEGEKTILRDITQKDVNERYVGFLNDPEVTRFLYTKPGEQTKESLAAYVREKLEAEDCIFLAVLEKKTGLHIGNVKLEPIDFQNQKAVLGIMLGDKSFWGKGYGTDAVKAALRYSFDELGLNKVSLGVVSDNSGAMKAYEKAGFKVEGVLREDTIWGGKKYDRTLMAVLKKDYR